MRFSLVLIGLLFITGFVHGSDSPPCTSVCSNVLVTGAGTCEVNGIYTYRGTYEGKPYYNLTGKPSGVLANGLFWAQGEWHLQPGPPGGNSYLADSNADFPWQATWTVEEGEAPVPSIVEYP